MSCLKTNHLFKILEGETQPSFPSYLTPEGHMALDKAEQVIHNFQRTHVDYSQPIQLLILPTASLPTVFWQSQGVLEWLHLPHSPARIIIL
jgi:hypothetical protein